MVRGHSGLKTRAVLFEGFILAVRRLVAIRAIASGTVGETDFVRIVNFIFSIRLDA